MPVEANVGQRLGIPASRGERFQGSRCRRTPRLALTPLHAGAKFI
jgi:hypothetical protein